MRGIMKIRNHFLYPVMALAIAGVTAASAGAHMPHPAIVTPTAVDGAPTTDMVPVTTFSPDARHDYELALLYHEDLLFVDKGLVSLRKAVKADPRFALAHAALGYFTTDPVEERREYALAQKKHSECVAGEKIVDPLDGCREERRAGTSHRRDERSSRKISERQTAREYGLRVAVRESGSLRAWRENSQERSAE